MERENNIISIRYIFNNILNKMLYGPSLFKGLANGHFYENSVLNYFELMEGKPS